jgi:hypothetical protein
MKKLILILLLLGCAGYAYWPYYATGQFRDAINAEDSAALDKLVDWPAVTTSLKEQARAFGVKWATEQFKRTLSAEQAHKAAETVVAKAPIDVAIEKLATSQNFLKVVRAKPESEGKKEVEFEGRSWNSATEFSVRLVNGNGRLLFRMGGLGGWKLVDFQDAEKAVESAVLVSLGNPKAPPQPPPAVPGTHGTPGTTSPAGTPPSPGTGTFPDKGNWNKGYKNPLDQRPK